MTGIDLIQKLQINLSLFTPVYDRLDMGSLRSIRHCLVSKTLANGRRKLFASTTFSDGTSRYPAKEELRYSKATVKTYKQSSGPLVEMRFTSDAKTLSLAFADGTATSCRLPFGKDRSPARYVGHEGPITSIDWNCNNN